MNWKEIYQQAHEQNFKREYPTAYKDGHYCEPKYPDVKTTNGITQVIKNFMLWSGHYANRINVMGRQIGGFTRTEAGNVFDDRKWIKSSTRPGTSDLMCSIAGRMITIEVKNAKTKDRVRPNQEKEKQRVERSGGLYVVIESVEQFFEWYQDYFLNTFAK
jgi:hypothetical protein